MRFTTLARSLAAGVVAFGSLSLMAPAQAAPAGSLSTKCQTQKFPIFDWAPTVDAKAGASAGNVELTLQLSDLPGVVPVSLTDLEMVGTVKGKVNNAPVTFTGTKTIAITSGKPFAIPAVTATFPSTETVLNVELTDLAYNIPAFAMNTVCPVGSSGSFKLDPITVDPAVVPSVSPSTSPSVSPSTSPSVSPSTSPSASASPTKSPKPSKTSEPKNEGSEGKASKGKVTFACVLSAPFNTPFDYNADIAISGAREKADDSAVKLSASFSKIPGLAPVPIENGTMAITVAAKVDGKAVTFKGNSTVNVGPNEVVPVPELSAEVSTSGETVPVKMETFAFQFGEMAGLAIGADCKVKSGSLSDLTIGVGELPTTDGDNADGAGGTGGTTAGAQASLPRTGGADAMPVIGLWALALGVVGAALLVWMPRRREV